MFCLEGARLATVAYRCKKKNTGGGREKIRQRTKPPPPPPTANRCYHTPHAVIAVPSPRISFRVRSRSAGRERSTYDRTGTREKEKIVVRKLLLSACTHSWGSPPPCLSDIPFPFPFAFYPPPPSAPSFVHRSGLI